MSTRIGLQAVTLDRSQRCGMDIAQHHARPEHAKAIHESLLKATENTCRQSAGLTKNVSSCTVRAIAGDDAPDIRFHDRSRYHLGVAVPRVYAYGNVIPRIDRADTC